MEEDAQHWSKVRDEPIACTMFDEPSADLRT
jgi:hypothetical protein